MTVKQVAVRLKADDDGSVVRMYKTAEAAGVHAADATTGATQRAIAAQERQVESLRRVAAEATSAGAARARIDAMTGVSGSGAGSARASARVLFAADEDYARQAANLRAVVDPAAAAQDRLNRELASYSQLARVGAISSKELAAGQALAHKQYDMTTAALNRQVGGITRLQAASRLNLSRQAADVAVTAAMGMNPGMIAIQQGPQILEAWATSGIRTGGVLLALAGTVTVVAGTAAALGLAWLSGEKASLSLERAATGLGRTAGVTAGELEQLAVASAEQAEVSTASARAQAAAYASTGKIGTETIAGLIAIGKDYAAVMGQDAEEATQSLAKAMSDPDKAARELTRQIGLLDQVTLDHIDTLVKHGKRTEAQTILLEALTGAVSGQADKVSEITSAWDEAARAVSNYWSRLGQALYTTPDERLEQLDQSLVRMYRQREEGSDRSRPQWDRAIAAEEARRAAILNQQLNDRARGRNATANQAAQEDRDRRDALPRGRRDGSADREARDALRRQRAEEDHRAELDRQIAAMTGDQDRVRVLEDEARVRARIRDLVDAGQGEEAARTSALADQARLVEARETATGREFQALQRSLGVELDRLQGNLRTLDLVERDEDLRKRILGYQQAGLDLDRATSVAKQDQLELDLARANALERVTASAERDRQIALARMAGNDRLAGSLGVDQRVEARAREIEAREKLNQGEGMARAQAEIRQELDAARLGGTRSWAQGLAADIRRSGIRNALADQLNNAADNFLSRLIDGLFDIDWGGLLGGAGGGKGGGGLIGAGLGFLFGGFGRNANGTDYWRGGPTWVGESGPELAWLPRGTAIADSARSMKMAAGGGAAPAAPMQVTIISRLEIPTGYVPDRQLAVMLTDTHDSAVRTAVSVAGRAAQGQQLQFSIHKG
tara:strand:- start:18578 stop:21292 length:2715 start_codon:yes stop_codon:yes gene_type:complete